MTNANSSTTHYITAVETLGCNPAISAINLICSGVVPQQPPMMFTKLSSKYSLIKLASVLAFHRILKAFGNPALGCAIR
jgi:hypothetical protein